MDDDKEFIEAIKDASDCSSATYAMKLFARMLVSKSFSQPHVVWEATWEYLTDDILYKKRRENGQPDMNLTIEKIKNIALTEIENHLLSNGCSLKKWPHMPKPEDFGSYNGNRLIDDDLKYVVEDQLKENERLMAMITDEQRGVYEQILDAVLNDSGGVFFLYGYGGTGKTFVYRALSSAIRSRGMIVLNTASSGIAALLLEGGRTAHSRFGIPIDADEFSTCKKMEPGSDRAELVKAAKLIVWDEVPMMSRHCFETLDRTMRDIIRSSENKPFGGKVIVFGGDFRQILPVIPGGGRAETVLAVLNSSYLWEHCKVLKLTKNMRLLAGLTDDAAKELQSFSNWILDIGDGKINLPNDVAGLPRHCLKLKVGAPIMCLRNMDVADGLCNGTRLIVTQLLPHVIEGRIITGNKIAGHPVWIPRMFVTPPDTKFPFRMRRRRFPVTLAFAMTINKSQGPTLESVGLFLPSPVFSHGQLYVALSRVKSRSGLKILITGKEGKTQTKTLNVVYKQVFQNIP
ncbi:BnaCnng70400D [Brassica napus]|uniref:ATP-dependent DNA helicase n=1 Tax=Brassica napus TaxID=3708 RepID=A0A078JWY6_BRANA|nr:BnaCnng70400D [Brassica napus]